MTLFEIEGRGGRTLQFMGECVATVEALNHDDTVRCALRLYATETEYVCQRVDRPGTIDRRISVERCADSLTVYQFFGTEPLANYLYGVAGLGVPGLRTNNASELF